MKTESSPALSRGKRLATASLTSGLPARIDRRAAAELVTARYLPVIYGTIEAWPLTWRHVNVRALVDTAELLAFAQSKLDAAPLIRGGKRSAQGES